jgi:hypothetical protein
MVEASGDKARNCPFRGLFGQISVDRGLTATVRAASPSLFS